MGLVIAHHIDIVALGAELHRIHRHADGVGQRLQRQADVHELIGKERLARIVEARPNPQRSSRGVDLVVQRGEATTGQPALLAAVPGLHLQAVAGSGGHRVAQRRQLHLRHAEDHRDGVGLHDADQAIRGGGTDHRADIGLQKPQAAGHRRVDLCVAQLHTGVVHLGLVGGRTRLQLPHQRALGLQLLAGHRILPIEPLVTRQIGTGILQLSLVLRLGAARLVQAGLQRARIQLGQQLAGLHVRPFLEMHAQQPPFHLRHHGDGVVGGDVAHGADHHRKGPLLGAHHADSDGRHATRPAGARRRGRPIGRGGAVGSGFQNPEPEAGTDGQQHQGRDHQRGTAPGRLVRR